MIIPAPLSILILPTCNNTSISLHATIQLPNIPFRPQGKESTEVRKSQIKGKESENSYQELKRSLKDKHTQTHGNCIEIFRQARLSFSIGRE